MLTPDELDRALQSLLSVSPETAAAADRIQVLVHELQVHRCELEVQNRALRDAQGDLEHAVHRYTELYDTLPIGYMTVTPAGRIVEANLMAASMLERPRELLPGQFLRQFLPPTDAAALASHLDIAAQRPGPHVMETRLERPGGASRAIQLSTDAVRTADGIQFRTALTDISALKEAQRGMQAVIAEQESFTYSISHDLRAPLLTISSFSKVLLTDRETLHAKEQEDILVRINRAAIRMDELLRNLLEYSRISRAEAPLERLELRTVIDDVLTQHQGLLDSRRAAVGVAENLPAVMGSRPLLTQAISNLLTNALKYTPPDRQPIVRIYCEEEKGRTVVLTIADEGIGIAPQHHERIFGIFERLHGTGEYPGTGIGLALVRRAMERMGGVVWVDSEPGRGSRFHLKLVKADDSSASPCRP